MSLKPASAIAPADESDDLRPKTKAEMEFDRTAYGIVGGGGTFAISVLLSDWIKNGSGRHVFARMGEALSTAISTVARIPRPQAAAKAYQYLVTTALMSGGILLLYPIKRMEDAKSQIVRGLHEQWMRKREAQGLPLSEDEKQANEAALALMDKQPQQTWKSIIGGRLFGSAVVYGSVTAAGGHMVQAADAAGDWLAREVVGAVPHHPAAVARFGRIKELTSLSMMEGILTATAASGLYLYTHFLCPPNHKAARVPDVKMPEPLPVAAPAEEPAEPLRQFAGELVKNASHTQLALREPDKGMALAP